MGSEKTVCDFLQSKGFTVSAHSSEAANGYDVVAIKNGEYFTIEVKTACKSNRCYRVGRVSKAASKCTHIAIVTPKGNIIIQTMSDHLRLCSRDGTRRITLLVKIYDC